MLKKTMIVSRTEFGAAVGDFCGSFYAVSAFVKSDTDTAALGDTVSKTTRNAVCFTETDRFGDTVSESDSRADGKSDTRSESVGRADCNAESVADGRADRRPVSGSRTDESVRSEADTNPAQSVRPDSNADGFGNFISREELKGDYFPVIRRTSFNRLVLLFYRKLKFSVLS